MVLNTDDAIDLLRRYLDLSDASGHSATATDVPFFRYFYVAETEEQAHRDARDALNWTLDLNTWRREFTVGSEVYHSIDDYRRRRATFPPTYEYLAEHRAFIGDHRTSAPPRYRLCMTPASVTLDATSPSAGWIRRSSCGPWSCSPGK